MRETLRARTWKARPARGNLCGKGQVGIDEQPRRQRRPHEKLARIIASATTVFSEEGYARARIHAVCHSAGVSIGTFYSHFENKAELMLQVAEHVMETIQLPDATTLSQLEEQLAALAAAPSAGFARAWIEAINTEPEVRAASERIRGTFLVRYTQWVANARARRRCRPSLDDEMTARAVMALVREATSGTYGPMQQRVAYMSRAIWTLLYAENSDAST